MLILQTGDETTIIHQPNGRVNADDINPPELLHGADNRIPLGRCIGQLLASFFYIPLIARADFSINYRSSSAAMMFTLPRTATASDTMCPSTSFGKTE